MRIVNWLLRLALYPVFRPYVRMPGRSYRGLFAALNEAETGLQKRLHNHVRILAEEIGERSIARPTGLQAAERYIHDHLRLLGYAVETQRFNFADVDMANVIVEKKGTDPDAEILVIGAHYDTVIGTPGADDNATGVAALLEIARWLKTVKTRRTVRLVAFANEEHPGGPWESMGSCHYANRCKERGDKIVGMLSLEMLGVYSEAEGSQKYPWPFNLFYPTVANFVAFVGNRMSADLVQQSIMAFRMSVQFPSEGVAAPDAVKDIARSDHWAFWQIGVPALMVTDTSNFRYPIYHTPGDTLDKLNFECFARVTGGIIGVVRKLAM